jgi:hypothetical protein
MLSEMCIQISDGDAVQEETIGNIRSLPRLTERPFSGPALTQQPRRDRRRAESREPAAGRRSSATRNRRLKTQGSRPYFFIAASKRSTGSA